jgi:hypothetical protein
MTLPRQLVPTVPPGRIQVLEMAAGRRLGGIAVLDGPEVTGRGVDPVPELGVEGGVDRMALVVDLGRPVGVSVVIGP